MLYIYKLKPLLPLLFLCLIISNLYGQSDNEKILILTDYIVKNEAKTVEQARSEALATVYGKPLLKDVIYDEQSETFFAKLTSEKGNFTKNVNFYMPYQQAAKFKKDLEAGRLDIKHAFEKNKIFIQNIELNYNDTNYPMHTQEPNTFTLKIGGYIVDAQETDVTASKHGLGANINFQDLLGMPEDLEIFRVNALYKFNAKHSLEFSYYSIGNDSFSVINQELNWGDTNIKAGAQIQTHFDTDIYKINYNYSFYKTNKITLDFRVGLHITSLDTGLIANGDVNGVVQYNEVESMSLTAPLPIIGLGLSYNFTPKLKLNYNIDYFFLTVQDLDGNMLDSLLSLDYQFNRYVGLGAGYNITNMNFNAEESDLQFKVKHKISGALVYLILSY